MTRVELTPMDILGRVIHGAARPLAHFLEDALTACIGTNYISVVNRLLSLDGTNQKQPNPPVDSLFRLDLPNLLKLVDQCFYLPRVDTHHETEWKVEFRSLFGVPKGSDSNHKTALYIQNQVVAGVRKARNDYAHHEAGRSVSARTVKGDLYKMLDLYQIQLHQIAMNNPKIFSLETASQLSEYVDVVEYSLRSLESSARPMSIGVKVVGATVLLALVASLIYFAGVFDSKPKHSILLMSLDTIPSDKMDKVAQTVVNHAGLIDEIELVFLDATGRKTQSIVTKNREEEISSLRSRINSAGALSHPLEYGSRFGVIDESLQLIVADGRKPTLLILGSVGAFSADDLRKLQLNEVKFYPRVGMSAWWTANEVPPPTFVYWSRPTSSDSILFTLFSDKTAYLKPVVKVFE